MSPGATRFKQRCTRLIPWLLIALPVIWLGTAWLAAREITPHPLYADMTAWFLSHLVR